MYPWGEGWGEGRRKRNNRHNLETARNKTHSILNAPPARDDFNDMFPLYELLSHAELSNPRPVPAAVVEARRAPRMSRYGNLTLYPCVERPEPIDELEDEPRVLAALSNISPSGVGLLHSDELPLGMLFDVEWQTQEAWIPLRFEVVHSRPTSAGMYRTGARLICGELPELPMPPTMRLALPAPAEPAAIVEARESEEPSSLPINGAGVLRYEPDPISDSTEPAEPAPPGTFYASSAFGFDKTERLDGVTTCGWERSIEIRRAGDRLWIYIHSPGKKNGWGIFVDPDQFDSALARVQSAAASPFITTLAA
jgi:hypothetical protein